MIRKLEWNLSLDDKMIVDKINELVYAVGRLETMAKNTNTVLESLVEENNIHEKQIDELQMKVEPEKCEAPADPYTKQRKCIGCLCRMKPYDWGLVWDYKILERINENNPDLPFVATDGDRYKVCEPVLPEDGIIYKGDNNE